MENLKEDMDNAVQPEENEEIDAKAAEDGGTAEAGTGGTENEGTKSEGEDAEAEENEEEAEETVEEEIIVYGRSKIDGVAVHSAALVQATEDYPVILMINVDFKPVKVGDEISTPYDAVVTMDEIQVVGPMIRLIKKVEPMTNVEAI